MLLHKQDSWIDKENAKKRFREERIRMGVEDSHSTDSPPIVFEYLKTHIHITFTAKINKIYC